MSKYVIGLDYGTLSARALLVDVATGQELAQAEFVYPHAVLGQEDFPGSSIGNDAALQDPQDYLDALSFTLHKVLETSGVAAQDVLGLGIDFTAATILAVDQDGIPLCFQDKYRNNPHTYAKLWKHHGAQWEAYEMTRIATERNEPWLGNCGGKVSSEWAVPKIWETLRKAPQIYHEAARFIEAADWLVWMITGKETRNSCCAGFKALWDREAGYPSNSYFAALDPKLADLIGTKIPHEVIPTGTKAGEISAAGSKLTGLLPGTTVAAPIIDGHAGIPGAGVVTPGKMMLIIGTSAAGFVLDSVDRKMTGICGCVSDGVIPGYYAYEAGQSCVGDAFGWFVENCVPEKYALEAKSRGLSLFGLLDEKAAALEVGQNRLVVLDWWNGCRSPLADYDLSGMILGLTLKTKPEDIYRALIESTAFGARAIMERYRENGIVIEEAYAAGGICRRNPFLMQLYADILGIEIRVCTSTQATARGSAVFAGLACGYYDTMEASAAVLADKCEICYAPNPENTERYLPLYEEYTALSQHFGKETNVMKRLKAL